MKKSVYVVSGDSSYHALFTSLGFRIADYAGEADVIVFTGGADVTPAYYGHPQHNTTHNDVRRDDREKAIFEDAISRKVPMIGICRGAQFLNVMSGGEMYQDVSKHCMAHDITDLETGEVVYVSSTHHQMMKPAENSLLVASSRIGGSREWWDGEVFKRDVSDEDIEVVWYSHTKSLCFQPHPEHTGTSYIGMRGYFESLINRFIMK